MGSKVLSSTFVRGSCSEAQGSPLVANERAERLRGHGTRPVGSVQITAAPDVSALDTSTPITAHANSYIPSAEYDDGIIKQQLVYSFTDRYYSWFVGGLTVMVTQGAQVLSEGESPISAE